MEWNGFGVISLSWYCQLKLLILLLFGLVGSILGFGMFSVEFVQLLCVFVIILLLE